MSELIGSKINQASYYHSTAVVLVIMEDLRPYVNFIKAIDQYCSNVNACRNHQEIFLENADSDLLDLRWVLRL